MTSGCPTVLSKHLEVTSTHLEDSKLKGDRLLSVGFRTLFLDCSLSYLDHGSSLFMFSSIKRDN